MEPYPGDILEHALNKGLVSAAARYAVPIEQVRGIVQQFAAEIGEDARCPCELAQANGVATMCFACTGPVVKSRFVEGCDVRLLGARYDKRIHLDGAPS